MLDLDGFKQVNDTHGHEAGDQVLQHVAKLLERNARRNDVLARMGGDEFVLVLAGLGAAEPAQGVARKIIEALHAPLPMGSGRLAQIGASIGIALSVEAGESTEEMLRRADQAMYAVKRSGKNDFRLAPRVA
jgi:diguanylate cyclase (GGDEF)-like protein